jgi:hypothetical protein
METFSIGTVDPEALSGETVQTIDFGARAAQLGLGSLDQGAGGGTWLS